MVIDRVLSHLCNISPLRSGLTTRYYDWFKRKFKNYQGCQTLPVPRPLRKTWIECPSQNRLELSEGNLIMSMIRCEICRNYPNYPSTTSISHWQWLILLMIYFHWHYQRDHQRQHLRQICRVNKYYNCWVARQSHGASASERSWNHWYDDFIFIVFWYRCRWKGLPSAKKIKQFQKFQISNIADWTGWQLGASLYFFYQPCCERRLLIHISFHSLSYRNPTSIHEEQLINPSFSPTTSFISIFKLLPPSNANKVPKTASFLEKSS